MRSYTCFTLAAVAGLSTANLLKRQTNLTSSGDDALEDYFASVCFPTNSNDLPDYTAPCWAYEVILAECAFGSDVVLSSLNSNSSDADGDFSQTNATQVSPREQQVCICQSQWFNEFQGCLSCATKHGLEEIIPVQPSAVSSVSSSYCNASYTPYDAFDVVLETAFGDGSSSSVAASTSFSDPIGNKTDVSLYFTPSITGTGAYVLSQPTASSSASGSASGSGSGSSSTESISASISGGQIVATQAAASTSSGASSSSSKGAAPTAAPAEKFAMAGAVGMAAVVALL